MEEDIPEFQKLNIYSIDFPNQDDEFLNLGANFPIYYG
jgi:hypothetical protein